MGGEQPRARALPAHSPHPLSGRQLCDTFDAAPAAAEAAVSAAWPVVQAFLGGEAPPSLTFYFQEMPHCL